MTAGAGPAPPPAPQGDELDDFTQALRDFIGAHLPHDIREAVRLGLPLSAEQQTQWHVLLAEHGLLVPHWPRAWGGQGWSVQQQLAFDEVMCTHHAPELNAVTFDMIGPVLIRYGNPQQQQRFLPAIASGRQWWCQGYSEPNAGSDLAALGTRARRDGAHYIVEGTKIWTSYAQYADWMFCLVRTDTQARKQAGISFLLIDMRSPGITVRPIVGIHGWTVFNEVFLDQVKVPLDNLVGEENAGWAIAKSLLEFERLKLARVGENKRRRQRVLAIASQCSERGQPLVQQPWFRARFAELDMRLLALEAHAAGFIARAQAGQAIGADVSMLKLRGSQLIQRWEELTVDALGPDALVFDAARLAPGLAGTGADDIVATASSRRFLSRGYTIAGGSSEIQHDIIARQVLGL
jgi:acyl-CoA dehydrogenase